ncbi:MAG: 4Fe-4S binding protein [Rhodospirillales bacterium]
MAKNEPRVLICDCAGTNPLNAAKLRKVLGLSEDVMPDEATMLCRYQLDRFEKELGKPGTLVVGCTQEAPLFLDAAQDAAETTGVEDDIRFVNIREKAGWSKDAKKAGPKIAALLAESLLALDPAQAIDLECDGVALVLGKDEAALDAATKLAQRLDVTLLLTGWDGLMPPRISEIPIFVADKVAARGHLGAFEVLSENAAPIDPSSRDVIGPAGAGAAESVSQCDLILDLRGETPLFNAHDKRDGYFRVDSGDPASVMGAIFEMSDMVGTFEKPQYVEYDSSICAHARSGITGCSRCIDNCPTGAIQSAGDKVEIDPYICAGCGNCASACPTGAVRYVLPQPEDLLRRLRTLAKTYTSAGGEHLRFLFHDSDHGEQMIDAIGRHFDGLPANVVPVAVNAATQISLETLLGARAFGAEHCHILTAPRDAGELDVLRDVIGLSNHILGELGYGDGRAEILDDTDPEKVAGALRDAATKKPKGKAAKPEPFEPVGRKRGLMNLALVSLHGAAPTPTDEIALPQGAPFGTVDVDLDKCTLCLSCVGACPANALRDNPEYPRLSFVESACVQCGICEKTCPEDAISIRTRLSFTDEARNERTIKEEEPFNCVSCGKPFGTRSTIEAVVTKMTGHSMFADDDALNRLRMCADCRVVSLAESVNDPFAGKPRPLPKTADDLD